MPENVPPGRGDDALERELRELARDLDYPPTPDLASSVRRRLEGEARSRRRTTPVWAVAAALLAVFLVVPAISVAVFEPFGDPSQSASSGGAADGAGGAAGGAAGGGVGGGAAPESARQDDMMSEAAPEESSSAGGSSSLARGLDLGERIPLATAEARMGDLLLPADRGRPDGTYATQGPTGNGVVFVYGTRQDFDRGEGSTGFVLSELPGGVEAAFGTGTGSEAPTVEVGDGRGVWVSGPGAPEAEDYRLTEGLGGSALLFTRGDVALRLESNLAREEAIRLAETVR